MPDTATLDPQTEVATAQPQQDARDDANFHEDVDALLNEASSLVEDPEGSSAADGNGNGDGEVEAQAREEEPPAPTNPWAAEAAELEQGWAGQEKEDRFAVSSPVTADAREAQATPAEPLVGASEPRGRSALALVRGLGRFAGVAMVQTLVLVDKPFSFLGPRIKNLLGYLAIATLGLSAVVWLLGPVLRQRFLGW